MKPKKIKELAARILKCGSNKVWLNPAEFDRVKAVMTLEDTKALIKEGIIKKAKASFQSKGMARILKNKKKKGRKRSYGSRRGTKKARSEQRLKWISKTRALRQELRRLRKEKPRQVEKIGYRKLYKMINGNFFRGKRYLAEFVEGRKSKE